MINHPPHGSLATRYAALQQRLDATVVNSFEGGASLRVEGSGAGGDPRGQRKPAILIGASKTQPAALLEEAIGLGLEDFGENRVQEAYEKWPALKAAHPEVRLHLIGPLQSNKAKEAVALFDVIHTIDRVKIAEAVAAEATKQNRHPRLLIQVNIGEEEQKSGVTPQALPALIAACHTLGLTIDGLMCVPPTEHNPAPYFALMQKLARRHRLPELSMGMSGDFTTAVRFGATMVRVGTALFGERG